MFTNPLDNISVASPCTADWNEMFGDERRRFCSECKLNVYNLSGMTRREAEDLLLNTDGRICVRYFKRSDGTVLTTDCPVGWAAVKRRVSRAATAAASIVFGFAGGLIGLRAAGSLISVFSVEPVPVIATDLDLGSTEKVPVVGVVVPQADFAYQGGLSTHDWQPLRMKKSSHRSSKHSQR